MAVKKDKRGMKYGGNQSMVKKIMTTILIVTLFGLTGCTSGKAMPTQTDSAAEQKLKIVTTIFPQYDFARQVGGEYAEVTMLLKPGAETHSFEPTPQDMKAIQNADLFIYVGGENDVWADSLLDSLGDQKPDTLKLLDCVATVEEEQVEGMQGGHAGHDRKRMSMCGHRR